VVVTHVEAVEDNRKHVMRLRIACVGSMNHLLDSVEPHHQWRGLGGAWSAFDDFQDDEVKSWKIPTD
jgi:hypothetical protein